MASYTSISPPYIDPRTGDRYETENPDRQGWLIKRSDW